MKFTKTFINSLFLKKSMDIITIIFGAIALVLLIILLKFLKSVAKSVFYAIVIIIIIACIITFFVVADVVKFSNGMKNQEVVFLLKEDESVKTGFFFQAGEVTDTLSNDMLNDYTSYYQSESYEMILGGRHKLFIFDLNELSYDDNKSNDILDFLKNDPDDDAKIVSSFHYLVVENMQDDPLYLVKEYKNGNIVIYPETLTFKILKLIK